MVKVNDVLVLPREPVPDQARVVRIDPKHDRIHLAYLRSGRFPKCLRLSDITADIDAGKIAVFEVLPSPAAGALRPGPDAEGADETGRRSSNWKIIEPLVSAEAIDQLFDPEVRGVLI